MDQDDVNVPIFVVGDMEAQGDVDLPTNQQLMQIAILDPKLQKINAVFLL